MGTKVNNPEPVMDWGFGPEYKDKFEDDKKRLGI